MPIASSPAIPPSAAPGGLLAREVRWLLDQIDGEKQPAPVESADAFPNQGTDREMWFQRAMARVEPAEIWADGGDDCSWLLARVDLTAMTEDPDAPVAVGRALENHLRSLVPPAA